MLLRRDCGGGGGVVLLSLPAAAQRIRYVTLAHTCLGPVVENYKKRKKGKLLHATERLIPTPKHEESVLPVRHLSSSLRPSLSLPPANP